MKYSKRLPTTFSFPGIGSAILVASPLSFLFVFTPRESILPIVVRFILAGMVSIAGGIGAVLLEKKKNIGKIVCLLAIAGLLPIALPFFAANPFRALTGAVLLITSGFFILDTRDRVGGRDGKNIQSVGEVQARSAAFAGLFTILVVYMVTTTPLWVRDAIVAVSSSVAQVMLCYWIFKTANKWRYVAPAGVLASVFLYYITRSILVATLAVNCLGVILTNPKKKTIASEHWWMVLLNQPARLMLSTFLILCIFGTVLLSFPVATTSTTTGWIDAAFTSVSAVCVTGLTVLDTSKDFSPVGQLFILLLIQLGGLGIMTITTVALYAMGRRISLKQEQLLMSLTDTDSHVLFDALRHIVLFTVIAEMAGAVLLSILFYRGGDAPAQAIWRGVFTAISAFCNAGFSLQHESLLPYMRQPVILYVIALLIIIGGIAPATCMIIPRWIQGRHIPVSMFLALTVTVVLLLSGTVLFLAFEWDNVLANVPLSVKLHNAFFQSVTLRTAGFNSLPIEDISIPTLFLMVCFMFIGGSPGGTAGGIKTTTIGVLALTFFNTVAGSRSILLRNRRIPSVTVYKAMTIVVSGCIVWLLAVFMLTVTQQIPLRNIVFEVTSALGTVGLTIGATMELDEIGKIIVMIVMFTGRIGPMTLFMLLGRERSAAAVKCSEARISLG